ncbi:uncharacterized protein EI90DRAFT_3049728 [Cantharellus anzutake]|uniref:uncharacterized protein n=1 Tax=Cantharellus anzutake TaxID=1750568 RepID=UPI0019063A2F|nr:uncharacterized protein EI90DRAFT_3082805 [Cantharellus anzutake]XP_038918163.1 uncharacterized protein EI90DRAFT_3049728 [Cantharellus anzutake]KAF8318942.1 hypothetical protein EI90DRAFT_3082805 [Cantharellus anzutake]KAF8334657.1 hypothetical protein EI90DRAFT_3049728 [Cantharellus anzutake]
MSVRTLQHIPTLAQAFVAANIQAPDPPAAHHNPILLRQISIWQGDITKLEVDAIVNAANRTLLGGGGVDGAIHRAAGPRLLNECQALDGAETGEAKITSGYDLPARHVLHTVGPVYSRSKDAECARLLALCYRNCLNLAYAKNIKSIAFPSISTGLYGYPIRDATHIAMTETRKFLDSPQGQDIERVVFVVFLDTDKDLYDTLAPLYFPPSPPPPAYSEAD